jgi:catechol 2,3-dioxygenase-like lactoylglutathione lyase family enzyme
MRFKFWVSLIAMSAIIRAANPVATIKPTLDVGIIVSDIDRSKAFYGGTLGLKETAPMQLPDGTTLTRYQMGTAILKLRAFPKAAKYSGDARAAIGFRLLTLYFGDIGPILKRWTDGGGAAPRITDGIAKGAKVAFVSDPDGNRIELVSMPSEIDVAALDKIAIGLTVSNVEQSREFYGKILGLPEDEPLAMSGGGKEFRFMAGKTQIKFWAGAADLPKHTGAIADTIGFRYFTFLVNDVDALAASFKEQGVNPVRAPYDLGNIARIMMVADPDGNWIEFAARKARAR